MNVNNYSSILSRHGFCNGNNVMSLKSNMNSMIACALTCNNSSSEILQLLISSQKAQPNDSYRLH